MEALLAGNLWRRYQRPGTVATAYVERVIPLALTLLLAVFAALTPFALQALGFVDWPGVYLRTCWPLAVALAVLVVAQVAAWRGWYWPLRLLLLASGVALALFNGVEARLGNIVRPAQPISIFHST